MAKKSGSSTNGSAVARSPKRRAGKRSAAKTVPSAESRASARANKPQSKASLDKIIHGDCVTELAKLDAGTVDLVFADPPFNIGYDYDEYDDKRSGEDYLDWSKRWMEGVVRCLKSDGAFWLAIGDEYAAELKVLATRELGLTCRSWVIWYYTFGVHCKYKFTRSHAHLLYFVNNPKSFVFNSLEIRVPSARELVYGDKRANPNRRVPDDTWMMAPVVPTDAATWDGFILRPQDIPERFPPTSDTWFYSRVAGTFKERKGFHGCQMPEQLLARIIRACSNESDIVLDPFAGSGTTLAVAKKLNRPFIGFELSENYTGMIRDRLSSIKTGDPVDGPENSAMSGPKTNRGRRLERAAEAVPRKVSKTPPIAKAKRSLNQIPVADTELTTAIGKAFAAAHQGFSADRVLAEPALNDKFLNNCRHLGIAGGAREWNHLLLNLRKRGGRSLIDTLRRTVIRRANMDPYIFASEIAWRRLSEERDLSLDDILCDPVSASKFDSAAKAIAPGFTSFHYRWAALALRKYRGDGNKLLDQVSATLAPRTVNITQATRLPASPGHYMIKAANTPFFVGFATSLRECPLLYLDCLAAALDCMASRVPSHADVTVRTLVFDIDKIRKKHKKAKKDEWAAARRARLIEKHAPVANAKPAA